MPRIGESIKPKRIEWPVLSKQEIHAIDAELEKFRTGEKWTIQNLKDYYASRGATTPEFSVKDIVLFQQVQNELEQVENWRRKKEYAQKMSDGQLDQELDITGIADLPF